MNDVYANICGVLLLISVPTLLVARYFRPRWMPWWAIVIGAAAIGWLVPSSSAGARTAQFMRRLSTILVLLLARPVLAEDSVVIGKATAHFPIDAEVPCPPSDENGDYICMDAWIGFKIYVTETIAGPKVSGTVRAARIQHTEYVRSYRARLKLFVLKPILTEELRKTLGADYLLLEATPERRVYCFSQPPAKYALADLVSPLGAASEYEHCFELERGRRE